MRYNTITPIKRDEDYSPDEQLAYGYGRLINEPAPSYPINEYRVLPDPKVHEWRTPKGKSQKAWKKVLADGDIKMTPYARGIASEEHFTVTKNHLRNHFPVHIWIKNECPDVLKNVFTKSLETRWQQTYDLRDFANLPQINIDFDLDGEIAKARNNAMSTVVSDQFSGFDLLTSMAELPETLELLVKIFRAAKNPLKGIQDLLKRYQRAHGPRDKISLAHSDFLNEWLQYRYAIMPLYHSIKDALETLDGLTYKYKTDRARESIQLPGFPKTKPEQDCVIHAITGEVTVRAVGKSAYLDPDLRLSDLLTINPFVTAWELLPLSFVWGWFINVGEWLFSQTATLRDLASQRSFCVSTKVDIEKTVTLAKTWKEGDIRIPDFKEIAIWGDCPPGKPLTWVDDVSYNTSSSEFKYDTLRLYTEKSYKRELFVPGDVELQFQPNLNWKRWLDAYALSFNLVLKDLKLSKR